MYPTIDQEKTGIKLKMMLKTAGYDVKFIQKYLHLSCPQPIYRWFKGKVLPSVEHLCAISILLDVHMEEVESAVANALDAKKAWIEAALEEGIEIHEPNNFEDYSGQFKLRLPRSLHRLLAEHSKREGISMNQYCVYLLSRNDAVYSK